MSDFQTLYRADCSRYCAAGQKMPKCFRYERRILYFLRKEQTAHNKTVKRIYHIILRIISDKHGIDIPAEAKIGEGFYIGHPYNIGVNHATVIGKNCNIHKGVSIGQENRGKRKGAPTIGDCVFIGINVTIVGKINIGDDVMIAPNTFVNCDVPSHSIVFGNPCIIKHKENATEGYVNNKV